MPLLTLTLAFGRRARPLAALVTTDKLAGGIAVLTLTAPLASVSVVSAVLLVGALGSSAVARQLAGMDPAVIGLPAHGLLATASRARSARVYAPKRLSAR